MRRTIASVFVFILVVSLLLTSCGKRRTFEPSGVTGEKAGDCQVSKRRNQA